MTSGVPQDNGRPPVQTSNEGPGRRSRLDTAKVIFEILAILIGGAWAGLDFYLKGKQANEAGDDLQRASIQLSSTTAPLTSGDHWVLSRLVIKNTSKRVVRTFMISWWYEYPPVTGTEDRISAVSNVTAPYTLAPGEESELQSRIFVKAGLEAIVAHADVILENAGEGLVCRISPKELLPEGGAEALTYQPEVCAARTKASSCVRDSCGFQSAESLVTFATLNGPIAQPEQTRLEMTVASPR